MKLGKGIQSVLIGIAVIATFYAYSEGLNQYNNLKVKNIILINYFTTIFRTSVILFWTKQNLKKYAIKLILQMESRIIL